MLLKSLEIQGFKTFPDKTRLTFDKGITSIVGPNGSGKSNISDAIRWVLGEQSPKAIRCSKMEDIIFNGTDNRKKQGYAEVTLTFENKDRILAFEGDEVSITRRFYRSGDSDYMINKASVRLKDIHELFMDTGLGRDGYSMIGQGKIDSIVASKSEDRREIFEEAAGISRYRYRKLEAERKLAGTEENLVRLRDILKEIEGRLEPLRIQSEKAQSFLEYSSQQRELEISLWVNTIRQSADILREQQEKLEIAQSQYNATEKSLKEIQQQNEELFEENNGFTQLIGDIHKEISLYDNEISDKRSKISVAENNILHNDKNIKRVKQELDNLLNSAKNTEKEIVEKNKTISNLDEKIINLQNKYSDYEKDLSNINAGVNKNSALLQEISLKISKLSSHSADTKVLAMTSMNSVSETKERINNLNNSKESRIQQIDGLEKRCSDYENMLKDIEQNVLDISQSLFESQQDFNNKQKQYEQLKNNVDKLNLDYRERIRRVRILEDLEQNMEGFYSSVKVVMRESKRGILKGIYGPVSRIINVPSNYTIAIETALGNSMQHIVTDNEESAKSAINFLKKNDGGRATFLPLTNIKGTLINEPVLKSCSGYIGIAAELCSCERQYISVLNSLLGRIIIVDNINNAVSIARKFNYKFRVVTLDGQVINTGGSLTGGSQGKKSGLLTRTDEIRRNKEEVVRLKGDFSNAEKLCKDISETIKKKEIEIISLKNKLSTKQGEKIKIGVELKSSQNELTNIKNSISNINNEIKLLNEKLEKQSEIHINSQRKLNELNIEFEKLEKQSNDITGDKEKLSEKREHLSLKLQNIKLEILTYKKDIENIQSEIKLELINESNRKQRQQMLENEINEYSAKNGSIKLQLNNLSQSVNELTEKVKLSQKKIDKINIQRKETEDCILRLRQQEREILNERENVSKEISRLEERKENLQKQYDEIIGNLWDKYEMTPREAEKNSKLIDNVIKVKKCLNELKNKIKSLGNVNVSAIEEYKEVFERHQFITKQVSDIEKSKNEILHLICNLTKQMKDLFVERFNLINQNFSKIFVELFGGGKAHLEMTTPEDVLNSGIEIIVHPPGKIVVHLEALSGGEKALVAIALYFAIMKVRPAPFCVMDEIEAALDDVNVDRFAQYLRQMNDKTQFILITHRRGTMEEADVLYGVTMQDKGISKLLSLRASEVAEKLNMPQQ